MPIRQPQKFIGFFKLIEAMKRPGCPVCRRIIDETHHAMESFLYESVNDSGLRAEIRRDGGLCHRHSWQLADFGDALGGAILFTDILESLMPAVAAAPRELSRQGEQTCYFCRWDEQTRHAVLTELVQRLDDQEVKAAWDGPAMLCMPHLAQVRSQSQQMRKQRPAALKALVDMHHRKYAVVCEQMKLLIVKQSYDHRNEEIGPERDSWLRAIEAIVGRSAGGRN